MDLPPFSPFGFRWAIRTRASPVPYVLRGKAYVLLRLLNDMARIRQH